ncbi:MAG: FAD-dependent oxidoreductase [Epsilonproteobacteria bacterium]|nr:FAD-dependent oxidoreductase [Campylobacterota bacterium]
MYDIVVIGSGGAGLTTALFAKELGKKVLVVTKQYPTEAQTCMAQGGINASLSPNDSIELHIQDTLNSSYQLADKEIVEKVCSSAPEVVKWLDRIGVPFNREGKNLALRKLGGASAPRACFAQDYTGLKILHTLFDNALKVGVEFLNEHFLLNLIVEDGQAKGVTLLDIKTSSVKEVLAKSVVLATGGFSKIYGKFSTNGYGAFGEGLSSALRAGAKLSDLEFVQFHPTSLKNSSILISEAARGAGGKIVDSSGKRFCDELATRDRLSREIYKKLEEGDKVFLDITHLGEEFLLSNLPQEIKLAHIYEGVDPLKEPIPIKPAAHYTIGGIDVDKELNTSIKSLYAVGECANTKFHGANRLGGNSLLEVIFFGKEAALKAGEEENVIKSGYEQLQRDEKFINALFNFPNKIDFWERGEFLSKVLYHNCGIIREEENLKGVLSLIRQQQRELKFMGLKDKSRVYNSELVRFLEYGNMLELSEALVISALSRKESRGAHFRKDYPNLKEEFSAHSVIFKKEDVLHLEFKKNGKD